jgi:hypothetical protein
MLLQPIASEHSGVTEIPNRLEVPLRLCINKRP